MAIIQFGPFVTGARGTIAGSIFSANKGGPYVRGWSRGANQRSEKQSAARAVLSTHAQEWRNLTPVQRAAWVAWAALPAQDRINSLGLTYSISGFNWFIKINAQLSTMVRPPRVLPPAGVRPTIMAGDTFEVRTGTIADSVLFTPVNPWLPDMDAIVFTAPAPSEGLALQTTHYNLMWTHQNPAANWNFFQANMEALYGDLTVNTVWFARVHRQTTEGLISPGEILSATCFN